MGYCAVYTIYRLDDKLYNIYCSYDFLVSVVTQEELLMMSYSTASVFAGLGLVVLPIVYNCGSIVTKTTTYILTCHSQIY